MALDAGNWIAILVAVVGVASVWGGFRYQVADLRAEVKALKWSIDKQGQRIGECEKRDAAFEERISHVADSVGLRAEIRRGLAQAGLSGGDSFKRRNSQVVNLPPRDDDDEGSSR
jgi:hypothetical protein